MDVFWQKIAELWEFEIKVSDTKFNQLHRETFKKRNRGFDSPAAAAQDHQCYYGDKLN